MKISVIIPAYNAAKWLVGTVQSIQAQTLPAAEIIVVDDGSTDATKDVCHRLGNTVRLVPQHNQGPATARNTGAAVAVGDWLLFLDADDRLLPHALEALARSVQQTGFALAYGWVLGRGQTPDKTRLHGFPYAAGDPPKPAEANFWWTAVTTPGAVLVKRSLHVDIGGFDEPMRHSEDTEYWLRCGMLTGFAHCDTVVLDKNWAPASHGGGYGENTWYRIKAQRRFLDWCRIRGFDTSFLRLRKGALTDHAIQRIFHLREWSFLEPILTEAERDHAFTIWYLRAKAKICLLKLTGRLPIPYVPPAISDTIAATAL